MVVVWVLAWLVTSVVAYFVTKAAFRCCCNLAWDRHTEEFVLVCSFLLGPLLLLISAELLLFGEVGKGLASDTTRRYKDS